MDWNQSSTLKLVAAVQKVEDNWGVLDWEGQGAKWEHIAAELQQLQSYLDLDTQDFPDVCKTRFVEICRYFNEVFTKGIRHNSLTYKVMTALASYSLRLNHDEYFPLIGPRDHFRPIILVDNEDASEESDHIVCGNNIVSMEFEDDKLNQDSKAGESLMATATSNFEVNKVPPGFIVTVGKFHLSARGSVMPIPRGYCHKYMPRARPAVLTCIRDGKQYQIKYLPHLCCLSAGWKNFVCSNALKAYDELVFFRLDNSTYQVKILGTDAQLREVAGSGIYRCRGMRDRM